MNPGHQDLQSGALLTEPFLLTLVIGMNFRVMMRAITRDIGILLISAFFLAFLRKEHNFKFSGLKMYGPALTMLKGLCHEMAIFVEDY
jgi:hypothetical protein